eukprot:354935-Chlamydomonas_euryale.AAC.7
MLTPASRPQLARWKLKCCEPMPSSALQVKTTQEVRFQPRADMLASYACALHTQCMLEGSGYKQLIARVTMRHAYALCTTHARLMMLGM